jgi:hypothetical protein
MTLNSSPIKPGRPAGLVAMAALDSVRSAAGASAIKSCLASVGYGL